MAAEIHDLVRLLTLDEAYWSAAHHLEPFTPPAALHSREYLRRRQRLLLRAARSPGGPQKCPDGYLVRRRKALTWALEKRRQRLCQRLIGAEVHRALERALLAEQLARTGKVGAFVDAYGRPDADGDGDAECDHDDGFGPDRAAAPHFYHREQNDDQGYAPGVCVDVAEGLRRLELDRVFRQEAAVTAIAFSRREAGEDLPLLLAYGLVNGTVGLCDAGVDVDDAGEGQGGVRVGAVAPGPAAGGRKDSKVRSLCRQREHTAAVLDIQWTDGNYFLLSAGKDATVRVWTARMIDAALKPSPGAPRSLSLELQNVITLPCPVRALLCCVKNPNLFFCTSAAEEENDSGAVEKPAEPQTSSLLTFFSGSTSDTIKSPHGKFGVMKGPLIWAVNLSTGRIFQEFGLPDFVTSMCYLRVPQHVEPAPSSNLQALTKVAQEFTRQAGDAARKAHDAQELALELRYAANLSMRRAGVRRGRRQSRGYVGIEDMDAKKTRRHSTPSRSSSLPLELTLQRSSSLMVEETEETENEMKEGPLSPSAQSATKFALEAEAAVSAAEAAEAFAAEAGEAAEAAARSAIDKREELATALEKQRRLNPSLADGVLYIVLGDCKGRIIALSVSLEPSVCMRNPLGTPAQIYATANWEEDESLASQRRGTRRRSSSIASLSWFEAARDQSDDESNSEVQSMWGTISGTANTGASEAHEIFRLRTKALSASTESGPAVVGLTTATLWGAPGATSPQASASTFLCLGGEDAHAMDVHETVPRLKAGLFVLDSKHRLLCLRAMLPRRRRTPETTAKADDIFSGLVFPSEDLKAPAAGFNSGQVDPRVSDVIPTSSPSPRSDDVVSVPLSPQSGSLEGRSTPSASTAVTVPRGASFWGDTEERQAPAVPDAMELRLFPAGSPGSPSRPMLPSPEHQVRHLRFSSVSTVGGCLVMGTHGREICTVPEATGDLASGLGATGCTWPVVVGGMHAGRVSRVASVLVEDHKLMSKTLEDRDMGGDAGDHPGWSVVVASADVYGQLLFWKPNLTKEPMAPPHWISQNEDDNDSSFSSPARHRVLSMSQRRRSLSSGLR